jgi:hypothetical protein
MDEFMEAVDGYLRLLEQEPESASREALLDGLRKQKEFFGGIREHLWQIGQTMSGEAADPVPVLQGEAFHRLLHDFDPQERDVN